ncbi:MAG: hypothetical protein P8Y18_04250 [Candidatus Bathyarchaeota archaeon]
MSLQKGNLESIIEKGEQCEKKYEWLQASKFYKKALIFVLDNDILALNNFYQKIGFCLIRSAQQAQTKFQFKNRIQQAVQLYNKATELFLNKKEQKFITKIDESKAMIAFCNSMLETDFIKKKTLLDKWWNLKCKLIDYYKKIDDQLSIAKTYNDMLEGSIDRYWIGSNEIELKEIRKELISIGEKAINILKKTGADEELARAYCWTSKYCLMSNNLMVFIDEKLIKKGLLYSKKAIFLSKKINDSWLLGWSYSAASDGADKNNDPKSALNFIYLQMEQGKIVNDNYILGYGRFMLSLWGFIYSLHEEDPEKNRAIHKQNLQEAKDVIHYYTLYNSSVQNLYYSPCLASISLASFELDLNSKYSLLKQAVEYGKKGVEHLNGWTHSPSIAMFNAYSWALYELSKIEKNNDKKRKYLNQIFENADRNIRTLKNYPSNFYMKAYTQNWIILAKFELYKITARKKKKIQLLHEAAFSTDTCLKIINNNMINNASTKRHQKWLFSRFGLLIYRFGTIHYQLYSLTKNNDLLKKIIQIYEMSLILFEKADYFTGIAESNWQKAKKYDELGEYLKSSIDFKLASKAYLKASEKIPQLKEFYFNHSLYLQAWSQIEQARYYHSIEEFSKSKENYFTAATLYKSSETWDYLASIYFAWGNLEEAENLSRKEYPQKAKEGFQEAYKQFNEAKRSIENKSDEIYEKIEKNNAHKLLKSSVLRSKYCQARIQLEEAKILDRQNKFLESSKKYNETALIIEEIILGVEQFLGFRE